LQTRESRRDFTGQAITKHEVAQVLNSCRIVDASRDPERRTYPSAGARFPVEIYIISFNVKGLQAGAYHFNIEENYLEVLLRQDLSPIEQKVVSLYLKKTALAIVMTAVIARSEVKYGLRAYPYSLLEAGHIGQNILLTCTKLGIGCCPVGGFVNDVVTSILDLTKDEIPIYVIGLGR
jgi:SagB-type dehydrogenase family enzyme